MKSVLLFANGEVTGAEIEKVKNSAFDLIVAADGGVHHALKWGYAPDIAIGDFDSVTPEQKASLPETLWLYRPDQEMNDLEKALLVCEKQSAAAITILGIGGGRLDHTLNNLSVLSRYDRKFDLTIYDAHSQIFLVRDYWKYEGQPGRLISLIPSGTVAGVRTAGLAFPLNNEPLVFGKREGLSNYLVSSAATVSIENGLLFIFAVDERPFPK